MRSYVGSDVLVELLFLSLLDEVGKIKIHNIVCQPVSTTVDKLNGDVLETMEYKRLHLHERKSSTWVIARGSSKKTIGESLYVNDIILVPDVCDVVSDERKKFESACGAIKASPGFFNSILYSRADGSIGTNAYGRFGQYLHSFLESETVKYLDASFKKISYRLEFVSVLKKRILEVIEILETEH
ncbi:MAG: hypothetical protein WCO84_02580 [bacterium]